MATIDIRIAANTDDCVVYWNGDGAGEWLIRLDSVQGVVGYGGTIYKYGIGLRFLNVLVGLGSTITSAKIQVTASADLTNDDVNSKIHGEKSLTPATFSTYADYNARTRTTAVVNWNAIENFATDTLYDSPDIKTIIQEIVDQVGWESGKAITIFWDDHDGLSTAAANTARTCYRYIQEETPVNLHIEYTPPTVDLDLTIPTATIDLSAPVLGIVKLLALTIPTVAINLLASILSIKTTGLKNMDKSSVVSPTNMDRHSATAVNTDKHSASAINTDKHSSSITNQDKHSASAINLDKS